MFNLPIFGVELSQDCQRIGIRKRPIHSTLRTGSEWRALGWK